MSLPGSASQGLSLHAKIKVRMPLGRFPEEQFPAKLIWSDSAEEWSRTPTSATPGAAAPGLER